MYSMLVFHRGIPASWTTIVSSRCQVYARLFPKWANISAKSSAPVGDSSTADCGPLSRTPPHCKPPPVQQGTITKDRTRRLETVAGPDIPVNVGKVLNANASAAASKNVPVRHSYSSDGIGGTSKCAAPVAVQKPVSKCMRNCLSSPVGLCIRIALKYKF